MRACEHPNRLDPGDAHQHHARGAKRLIHSTRAPLCDRQRAEVKRHPIADQIEESVLTMPSSHHSDQLHAPLASMPFSHDHVRKLDTEEWHHPTTRSD
jgi:hypothetical protein